MDPNWILAIIALCAIFSPIISTWLNNKYQLEFKQIELLEKSQHNALEFFIKSTEEFFYDKTSLDERVSFESSISNLFIYFSIPDYSLFDKLKQCIKDNDYQKTQFALSEITRFLSTQIKKK